jgi:hypothetical protein
MIGNGPRQGFHEAGAVRGDNGHDEGLAHGLKVDW